MIQQRQQHQQRRSGGAVWFTGMVALRAIGIGGLVAAAVFWWPVQSTLTTDRVVALAYTGGLVLAPPALWSFIFPWSPGGMLLLKIQARTVGFYVASAAALIFLYYSIQLQWSWWSAQPVAADTDMVWQQVGIGLLIYMVIPGLVWTPRSGDDLYDQVQQDQLVRRYEMQTKADIALLDVTLLRAQQKAAIGFANLLPAEREELAGVMQGLITGMDTTLQQIAGNLNDAARVVYGPPGADMFSAPPFADNLRDVLDYISESLAGMHAGDAPTTRPALAPPRGTDDGDGLGRPSPSSPRSAPSPPVASPPQTAAARRSPPRYAAEFHYVEGQIQQPFSAADLARAIGKSERTARDVLKLWHAAELVRPSDDLKNSWYFTEEREV